MTDLWRLLLRHNQRFPQRLLQLFNSCIVVLRPLRCLSLRNINVLSLNLDFLANESDLVGQCPSFQFERRINRGLDLVRDLGHDVLELNLWSQYFSIHTSIHRLCILRQYRQALRFGCRRQTWLGTFSLRRKQRWQGRSTTFTAFAALALALIRCRDLARAWRGLAMLNSRYSIVGLLLGCWSITSSLDFCELSWWGIGIWYVVWHLFILKRGLSTSTW